jgi:4-amino-4-deoxy-L-arabinose transferase-like glycosyltransferase
MSSTSASLPIANKKNNSEKLAAVGIWILFAYVIVRNLFAAAATPFWCDEVWTAIMARQFSPRMIWNALARAVDGQPPPFYFVERAAVALTPNVQIGLRLPSILGFACVLLCVFIFIRRRSGGVIALVCAAILLPTVLFDPYATDARPYSMVVACIALALVCYQRASETRWVIVMGLSLLAAEALHYFAVFAFVPFGLAEIAWTLKTRCLRIRVWLALATGLLPLALFWPLLLRLKEVYGSDVWGLRTLRGAGASYGWFLHVSQHYWRLGIDAVVVLLLLGALVALAFPNARQAWMAELLFHEHVLTLALLALPFVAYMATKLAHTGFEYSHVLAAAVAIPLSIGYIFPRMNRVAVPLLAIFILVILAVQEAGFWPSRHSQMAQLVPPVDSIESLATLAGHPDLPVVVSGGGEFTPIVYYASPPLAKRFVFVADPSAAIQYTDTSSTDINLLVESSLYPPFQVYEFPSFAREHSSFLLYSNADLDWWPRRLLHDGYSLKVAAASGGLKIYLVSRNGTSP